MGSLLRRIGFALADGPDDLSLPMVWVGVLPRIGDVDLPGPVPLGLAEFRKPGRQTAEALTDGGIRADVPDGRRLDLGQFRRPHSAASRHSPSDRQSRLDL